MNKTNDIETLFKEALELHNKNKLEKAEKIYLKILNFDPSNVDCLNNIGLIYKSKGNKEKAEQVLKLLKSLVAKVAAAEKKLLEIINLSLNLIL